MQNSSRLSTCGICTLLSGLVLVAYAQPATADEYSQWQERARAEKKETIKRLGSQHGHAVVTLKFVSKESFMGQEQKNEMEAPAVVVSPDGMVLAANSRLQGLISMGMRMAGGMLGGMMGNMPKPQSDTENIRVLIGNGPEELEAKLIARDSDLDLAWVQITDTKGRKLSYVDPADAAVLDVGDSYYTLSRMAERFDRMTLVNSSSIIAKVEDPRPLLVGSSTMWGAPVFTAQGKFAGFLVTQPPEEGEASAVSIDSMMTSMSFILPAARVSKALDQARQIARRQAEDTAAE